MASQEDPYRTLGIGAGASLNEIKSAYRRLVKKYHPDAAGERALPRFLAIQAAYERLVDGEGRLRPPAAAPGRAGPRPPAESWRADSSRARASRDAWRARRSTGSSRPAGAAGGSAGGTTTGSATGTPGSGPGEDGEFGWARPGAGARARRDQASPGDGTGAAGADRQHRERHTRRGPRKATPGSTTYDEAAELPLNPEWDGGAWYGPSSGTYWTINPREYADPRKHGPEYLARARRAARGQGTAAAEAPGPAPETGATGATDVPGAAGPDGDPGSPDWDWSGGDETTTEGGARWGTHAWRYDDMDGPDRQAGEAARGRVGADPGSRASSRASIASDPDGALPDLESIARRAAPRNLLAIARRPDRRWRLLLALVGWPPIGYAVATLIGEVTGCASFSATCPEPMPMLSLAAQPLVVALLFLVPPAAAVASFASIVGLAVALPFAAVFSVGSLPDSKAMSPVLGFVVAVAYFVALVVGGRAVWRAPDGAGEPPPGP